MHALLTESLQRDRLELRFSQKPPAVILQFIHATKKLPEAQRWRYDYGQKVWYAPNNEATRSFAEMLTTVGQNEMPVYRPTPLEQEWHEQLAQGLTHLPYEVWVEKFMEAMSDPAHSDFKFKPLTVKPRAYRWRRKTAYHPPVPTGADGNPANHRF